MNRSEIGRDTERDELVDIILGTNNCSQSAETMYAYEAVEYADVILAAGYRKPRTVTTAEELNELSEDTVIRDQREVLVFVDSGEALIWSDIWGNECNVELPATVLHEGAAE